MNKKIKIITSIIILLIMIGIQVSYAIPGTNNKNSFFTVNSEKIEPKETLKISFDLNKIEYNNFKIVLNSNINNNEIYTNDNIAIKEESDAVVVEIDKTKMNLSNIEMCYVIPEKTEINSKIQLFAKIVIEEEIENQDDEGNTTTTKQEKTVLEERKNITVVEKNENENENENQKYTKKDNEKSEQEENLNKEQKDNKNFIGNSEKSSNSNMNSTNKNINSEVNQSNKNTETATYNGSNNNYLSDLKVEGVDLNTNFNKENTTYFIKVTNTSNLNITATAEDSTAKVVITGNDNIKEGTNKILIAVTAENGNVRYYRIFVICGSSSQNQQNTTTSSSTSEVKSALIENIELHATYYLEEIYVESNSYVAKGDKILKYTNGTYLTAPYDCYVVELNVPDVEGKCLNSHYVKIQSKKILTVSMEVSEKNINKVSIGQEAKINILSLEKTYTGYITHRGSTESNGKLTVDIEIENDENIKLGMTSNIEINL